MDDPFRRPAFAPALFYRDPAAALDWLEQAFGFERSMVIADETGTIVHSEMRFRGGVLYIGGEHADFVGSPASVGRRCTQYVHVQIEGDVDGHCAQARACGAEILKEPADQFYGDRAYQARDPEGHVWSFGTPVRAVSREEAEAASGLTIEGWF